MPTANRNTKTHADPSAREIVATTHIDASPQDLWAASENPELIRRWWVCGEMTMPVCENDLRVGGAFRYVARMPDGSEHPMRGVYREVAPHTRIVHTQVYEPFPDIEALVTVTFEEREGGTDFTSRIVFPSDEAYQGATASGMESGMGSAIDRMAEVARRTS